MIHTRLAVTIILGILLLAGCAQPPESCPAPAPFDLCGADNYVTDDSLPFQFPLEGYEPRTPTLLTSFVASGRQDPKSALEYHAAEDSFHPAGTPVYAMADGRVSFSGPMGGYGWLIIIDHPQANLYSLYGHLSPSRWRIKSGTVEKGVLIAYLGDSDENGGSPEHPLVTHLHFGVRAGQRDDYPDRGEWRWQAGWIKLCPQHLGWLQPSVVITSQDIPSRGYPMPMAGFLDLWGFEVLVTGAYTIFGAGMLVWAAHKNIPFLLGIPPVLLIAAGIVLHGNGMLRTYTLLAVGMLLAVIGAFVFIRRAGRKPLGRS